MTEILFRSACPAEGCSDDNTYSWYHASCPSSSDEYLSDEAKIRCTYCGKVWDFFASRFECSQSNKKKKKAFLRRVISCLAALEDKNDISPEFYQKIKNSMKEQYKKYSE